MESWITVVISLASLLVAALSLWISHRANGRSLALDERMVVIEEAREQDRIAKGKRADLRARLEKSYASGRPEYTLVVENESEADALNVQYTLNGTPLNEHPILFRNTAISKAVAGKSSDRYPLPMAATDPPPYDFTARWQDESGQPGQYQTTLR